MTTPLSDTSPMHAYTHRWAVVDRPIPIPEIQFQSQVLKVGKLAVGLEVGQLKELNAVVTKVHCKKRIGTEDRERQKE